MARPLAPPPPRAAPLLLLALLAGLLPGLAQGQDVPLPSPSPFVDLIFLPSPSQKDTYTQADVDLLLGFKATFWNGNETLANWVRGH